MKIEVNIPALDRLCDILEKGIQLPTPAFANPALVVEVEKEAPAKKAAKVEEVTQEEVTQEEVTQEEVTQEEVTQEEVTKEEVTKVAKELVALRSPGELRTVLNTVIAAEEKISTCDPCTYPEIKAALQKRVDEITEEG